MQARLERARPSSSDSPPNPLMESTFFRESVERLRLLSLGLCLLPAGTFLLTLLFYDVLGWPAAEGLGRVRIAQLALLVLSLAMYALCRSSRIDDRRTLSLSLVYQVLGAIVICVPAYAGEQMLQTVMLSFSWLALWMLLIPFVAPACPRKNLMALLLCASMAPLVHGLWLFASGAPAAPWSQLVTTFLPNYIVAGVAMLPVFIILKLTRSRGQAEKRAQALGSYQLVERIGSGGMGEVWRGEHTMLARPAAIKLIKAELVGRMGGDAEEETLARFTREARTTAGLTSPHTVELYDFGLSAEGTFYYAMELLRGVDLDTLVTRGGVLAPGRVIHLLRQACASLAEAHLAGMVHRDIKPANIFVCRIGLDEDFVKVLDFGLVACTECEKRDPDAAKLTQQGFVVGTPAFMAPEQADGNDQVDARADIYALGCVAYFLLTGRLVFESSSAFHMMVDHLKTPPPPLSSRTEQKIPADLEELVMACLAKEPAERPASAAALDKALRACQQSAPWSQEDARAWWQEQGALFGITAAPVVEDTRQTMPSPVLLQAH